MITREEFENKVLNILNPRDQALIILRYFLPAKWTNRAITKLTSNDIKAEGGFVLIISTMFTESIPIKGNEKLLQALFDYRRGKLILFGFHTNVRFWIICKNYNLNSELIVLTRLEHLVAQQKPVVETTYSAV